MKVNFKLKFNMAFSFKKSMTLPKTESSNAHEQIDGNSKSTLMTALVASIALVKFLTVVLSIYHAWLIN